MIGSPPTSRPPCRWPLPSRSGYDGTGGKRSSRATTKTNLAHSSLPARSSVATALRSVAPEYGTVFCCWFNDETAAHERYVAFFGDKQPVEKPIEKPYSRRYASTSVTVIDPASRSVPTLGPSQT